MNSDKSIYYMMFICSVIIIGAIVLLMSVSFQIGKGRGKQECQERIAREVNQQVELMGTFRFHHHGQLIEIVEHRGVLKKARRAAGNNLLANAAQIPSNKLASTCGNCGEL